MQHYLMPVRQMSFLKPIRYIVYILCKFLTLLARFQFVIKVG
jgi:hypothetical protein